MSGAHYQVLNSQKFNKNTARKATRFHNVTAQQAHYRHRSDVARERRSINLTGLEINDANNNFRINLPQAEFMEDLHLVVKLKTVSGGSAKYRNVSIPAINLFKYISLTSGSSKVCEYNEPRSVFNYTAQTLDTQAYDAVKKIMGNAVANSTAGGSLIYPFPFQGFNRAANRGWRRANNCFPAGKLNIGSLQIDVITNKREELIEDAANCAQANLIDTVQLCWYTPVLPDAERAAALQRAYSIQGVDYRTRVNYAVAANTDTEIDLSYISGSIACIVFDARTNTENAAKDYSKKNELKSCKVEIDGNTYHELDTAVEQKFEALRDGIRENSDGNDTKISFAYNPQAYGSGSLNTAPIQKLSANIQCAAASTVDVLAVCEAVYEIRNGRLQKNA